jgi:hypothetical protein
MADGRYLLGSTPAELKRLRLQARISRLITERLLEKQALKRACECFTIGKKTSLSVCASQPGDRDASKASMSEIHWQLSRKRDVFSTPLLEKAVLMTIPTSL